MAKMKICCLCFSPKTGTVILGCLGILISILSLIPHCAMMENHEFYIREFVKQQRTTGTRDINDEDIPLIRSFSKMMWATLVAVDVIYIFASILVIAAVAAEKRFLLVPWLFVNLMSILFVIIGVLSVMFSLADINSLIVLFTAAPPILTSIYFWYAVYSTFHQLRQEEETRRSNTRQSISREEERVRTLLSLRTLEEQQVVTASASNSTLDSIKGSIQRVMGGTPPPPYETVAMEAKEEADRNYEECELSLFVAVSESPNVKHHLNHEQHVDDEDDDQDVVVVQEEDQSQDIPEESLIVDTSEAVTAPERQPSVESQHSLERQRSLSSQHTLHNQSSLETIPEHELILEVPIEPIVQIQNSTSDPRLPSNA